MPGLSHDNKVLFGTCGGLEDLTGINANIFRVAFVCMVLFWGAGLGLYLLCTLILLLLGMNNNNK